jgi:hypothetical protein
MDIENPLTIKASNNYPSVNLAGADGKTLGVLRADSNNRVYFLAYSKNSNYYERFYLPAPDAGLGENVTNYILTSKAPVTVEQGGTNAKTAEEACANLGAATVLTGKTIPSGADLNTYTTPGSYRSPSKEISSTLLNAPYTVSGFKMEVFNTNASDVFIQEIKCNSASARTYRRAGNKLSGVVEYGSWYKVMQSANDELGISDGGTGANTAVAASINLETLFLGDLTNAGHDIAKGTDLNDIPVGVYRSTSASISGTLVNTPTTGTGFRLIVSKLTTSSSLFQIAIQYYSADPRIWVRVKGDTWGAWKKITFS